MPKTNSDDKKFSSLHAPTWCPGCGNFAIWVALKKALVSLNLPEHRVAIYYGVGCSGNMSNTIGSYGWHSLHGRAVPTAVGAKLANGDLTVIVAAGDGDGYGEGMGHFIHAIRGNVDITYIVHDNSVYGLTTGQAAPTSAKGFKTRSTPDGLIEEQVNPIALALAAGASFVSRGFSGRTDELVEILKQAIQHRGFSLVDIFQPCVTFNQLNTYAYYYERVYSLQAEAGYDSANLQQAMTKAWETDRLPTGIFYQNIKRKSYDQDLPYLKGKALVGQPAAKRDIGRLLKSFT